MKSKRTFTADLENIIPLLINTWRRFHKEAGPGDRLQTREFRRVIEQILRLTKGQNEGDYFANREVLGAYLLYPWVLRYQEALSLIGEIPTPPKRVLDVCSGPAPFAFAALRHGASEVYATDKNVAALELGAEICGRYGMPLTVRRWDCVKEHLPIEGNFDLITVGHALTELFPSSVKNWQDKQIHFIRYLLSRLKPSGFLLLAESSQLEDNKRVLSLRDALVAEGVPIQAPCIWQGECPALKTTGSPCYAQREMEKPHFIKEIQRAANINLSSLKMTYLIVCSPEQITNIIPSNKKLYRIISPPIDTHQGKRFYLCGTDGKKSLGSHLKEYPAESRAFEYLRRGELIEINHGLEQGQAIDVIQGTTITVQAPCGKPVPHFTDDTF